MALAMIYEFAGAQIVSGTVSGISATGDKEPLPMANVYWSNQKLGVTSDIHGKFSIATPPAGVFLVFSYVGYRSDTLLALIDSATINIELQESNMLSEVEIDANASGSHLDRMNPLWNQEIGTGELQRAACCNLSESFETNASVDVNYTDAVTGARQIQLLGLSGIYSQLMIENIPFMRGLGSAFGLEYIPGTWMQSISVSKGTSAVLNGYESITGQINAEFKKPESDELLFFNYYANDAGRQEFNMNTSYDINKQISSIVLGHYSFNNTDVDGNHDGFRDVNTGHQVNVANFWQSISPKGLEMRWGVRLMDENRIGGQIQNSPYFIESPQGLWTSDIRNSRAEAFAKTGYIFKNKPGRSVGFINSFSWNRLDTRFGSTEYAGEQKSFYSNLIFHSPFKDIKHSYDAGFSFVYDDIAENLNDSVWKTKEFVPGAFFQYTYAFPKKITVMVGIRGDYNSRFGFLATPRLHVKFNVDQHTTVRTSVGMGYRSPYVIPENISVLASARKLVFVDTPDLERALNYGVSIVRYIDILGREMSISAEYFKTSFSNQMLLDMESDTSRIFVYSLNGKSYAHNAQLEVSYPVFRHLEVRAALRYNDVRYTFPDGTLQEKPLVSNYKGLLTFAFASNMKKWQADLTWQFVGRSRLPDRSLFPEEYRLPDYSPEHTIIHAQLTRNFKHWSLYGGVENLTNFTQANPILSADKPYSPYFDSGIIWGPVMGRKIYAGIRVKFNKKK